MINCRGLNGLELDYTDSFKLTAYSPTDYAASEFISLNVGTDEQLREVNKTLKSLNPNILLNSGKDTSAMQKTAFDTIISGKRACNNNN